MNSPISELLILKKLGINGHLRKAIRIKQVKCILGGSAKGNPGLVGCGGILRNFTGSAIGCFVVLQHQKDGKICGLNVIQSWWFKLSPITIWFPDLTKSMNFLVGHIFRECNSCDHSPFFVAAEMNRNRIGLPNYRFT
ncbi:hypothetical protein GmHk_16G047005 [Glycine max]|nr:hypothetical protein GmHk_16G047005 [Glycine max]